MGGISWTSWDNIWLKPSVSVATIAGIDSTPKFSVSRRSAKPNVSYVRCAMWRVPIVIGRIFAEDGSDAVGAHSVAVL